MTTLLGFRWRSSPGSLVLWILPGLAAICFGFPLLASADLFGGCMPGAFRTNNLTVGGKTLTFGRDADSKEVAEAFCNRHGVETIKGHGCVALIATQIQMRQSLIPAPQPHFRDDRYLDLVKKAIKGTLFSDGFAAGVRKALGLHWNPLTFTMIPEASLDNIRMALEIVELEGGRR